MEVQELLLQQNEKASLPTCASPCGDWIIIERNGAANNGSNGGEGISYSRKFAVIIVALWPSQHLSHPRRAPSEGEAGALKINPGATFAVTKASVRSYGQE